MKSSSIFLRTHGLLLVVSVLLGCGGHGDGAVTSPVSVPVRSATDASANSPAPADDPAGSIAVGRVDAERFAIEVTSRINRKALADTGIEVLSERCYELLVEPLPEGAVGLGRPVTVLYVYQIGRRHLEAASRLGFKADSRRAFEPLEFANEPRPCATEPGGKIATE